MSGENPRRRRPCKVWDHSRATRKSIMVAGLPELIVRGKEALGLAVCDNVRVAVEEDGTEVEDVEYFQTLPDNTVFLLLREGERWVARPEDAKKNSELQMVRAVIPKPVREAIPALGLREEAPTWQLSDHKGLITIFLEWDLRATRPGDTSDRPSLTLASTDLGPGGNGEPPGPPPKQPSKETFINHVNPPSTSTLPSIRISAVSDSSRSSHHSLARSPRQSSPLDSILQPHSTSGFEGLPGFPPSFSSTPVSTAMLRSSPLSLMQQHHSGSRHHGNGNNDEPCDFHCCALRQAESGLFHGITPAGPSPSPTPMPSLPSVLHSTSSHHSRSRSYDAHSSGHHVHFSRNEREYMNDNSSGNTTNGTSTSTVVGVTSPANRPLPPTPADDGATGGGESSESETEGGDAGESSSAEIRNAGKVLILSDRVTPDHRRHLTVRDLGVILDRLNSRISDVQGLTREVINDELYHWAIRATVRGDTMRNLGVLYQGNYYLIREQTTTGGNGSSHGGLLHDGDNEADTQI